MLKALKILKKLEFIICMGLCGSGIGCDNDRAQGHTKDCPLNAAIKEIEELIK